MLKNFGKRLTGSSSEEEGKRHENTPSGRRQSAPTGADIELPVRIERKPSFAIWKKDVDNIKTPAKKQPSTIPEASSSHRASVSVGSSPRCSVVPNIPLSTSRVPQNSLFVPGAEVTNRTRSNRFSDTSDLPPSPRTSMDLNAPNGSPDEGIPVFTRDSGLGPDMAEADVQIRLLNDTVQVLKENIDGHFEALCARMKRHSQDLKSQLDSFLTKTCRDISEGKTDVQKVEFHPQVDIGVGVITYIDEQDKTLVQPIEETLYENWDYINVERQKRLSSNSNESHDSYENMSGSICQELPRSQYELQHYSSARSHSEAAPVPHFTKRQQSVPGYINTNKPTPAPKPKGFQKK